MTRMIRSISSSVPKDAPRPKPPLAPGDRLTHEQFMERYALLPDGVKAELFEGIVYMPPPLSLEFHGKPHFSFITWLGVYAASTPGVEGGDNTTILFGTDDNAQPDIFLQILPSHGGRAGLTEPEGYLQGAPELIVEIAASSASYDLGAKLRGYQRAGVNEYIVHRTYDGEIDWFRLVEGQYIRQSPDADGIHRSQVFPGLWLAVEPMLQRDLAKVLTTLQVGLASDEHAAFLRRLSDAARKL